MNDAEYLVSRVEVVRGYGDYVPDEILIAEPESERFERAVDSIERALFTMDPDDLREWQEQQREQRGIIEQ